MKRALVVGSALVAVAAVSAVAVYAWSARSGRAAADVVPSRPHSHPVSVGHPFRARATQPLDRIPVRYPVLTTGDHGPAVRRLHQLLAAGGYLPLRFAAKGPRPLFPLQPRGGRFVWKFTPPAQLAALWQPGTYSTVTRGAVMTLEADRGLAVDGDAGPQVWRALLGRPAHHGAYTYVVVHETLPQSIDVYQDGHPVFSSPANTGIAAAPTAQGTWPVYLRYTSTTMQGTNPDGSHYDDPGVPWVSYFNGGDAVHGFLRASYGSPQSLGCVELPYGAAQQAYRLMSYGTLVTVTS